jgi:hypothetical protein
MSAQDAGPAPAARRRGSELRRTFWGVAGANVLLFLVWLVQVETSPGGEFSGLAVFALLVLFGLALAIVGVVALIRRPAAYAIGLALLAVPPLWWATQLLGNFASYATAPSPDALRDGRGYFGEPPDRALAAAIVAGDAAKVGSLAAAARLDAEGFGHMTFMRLALEQGHANPDVVAALLKAGLDPDQDHQLLFGYLGGASGVMTSTENQPLLRAVIDAGVDLNQQSPEGFPRFFSGLNWPEGLTLMLEHGADTEAEAKDGNTAIMWAVMLQRWPAVDVLLAHRARLDHIAHDGKGMRDIVAEVRTRLNVEHPPQLAIIEAQLR